jgi:F-type H+-transporting ATPase subunit epsilon
VQPDRVTILAKLAERADEIDLDRAEAARKRAEERLAHAQGDIDYERARIALTKSIARIHVAQITGGSMRRIREAANRG